MVSGLAGNHTQAICTRADPITGIALDDTDCDGLADTWESSGYNHYWVRVRRASTYLLFYQRQGTESNIESQSGIILVNDRVLNICCKYGCILVSKFN
ncbi:MAG: hypothetical protein ABJB85_06950 [Nitrososphaerota archaeon]